MRTATIYVAMHKRDDHVLTIKDPIYVPIHCGKSIYIDDDTSGYLPQFGDDTGDNISAKNHSYCELTAMYWAWKNDKSNPDDIIGLNHYRRYFCESYSDRLTLMTQKTMEKLLIDDSYHFIINSCCSFDETNFIPTANESVYKDFSEMHDIRDLDNAITAVHLLYPDIADEIERRIKYNYPMAYCNMLITTKKYFDEYASFLFSILQYVEEHGEPDKRGPGYVAERLFRPWLSATGHSMVQGHELDWSKYSGYRW